MIEAVLIVYLAGHAAPSTVIFMPMSMCERMAGEERERGNKAYCVPECKPAYRDVAPLPGDVG